MSDKTISTYLKEIEKALVAGNATEHTHRPALKNLIENLSTGITATNEPKRVKCGAPDLIITKDSVPLGYWEAKDVGKPLDEVEESEQLKRYFEGFSNLVLTDYLEFRWYVYGEHRLTAKLAKSDKSGKLEILDDGEVELRELVDSFENAEPPTVNNPKELADRMARLAKIIRATITEVFKTEVEKGQLHQQFEGFKKVLLHDLEEDQFADMYAQTICYGLFTARCNHSGKDRFTRKNAPYELPKTNPFLRKLFGQIAGAELDASIVWIVDDLAELLHRSDIASILRDFGKRTRREDPIVHFYETFLAAYDPKMREARGVYYTPEPVVSYIVRSVDEILKKDFNLPKGLADDSMVTLQKPDEKKGTKVHKVQILDPATGTGTFLHGVIDQIHEKFKGNKGKWSGYVKKNLLPRLYGFELLMAPYAVAHMKLGLQLAETGYDFKADERLEVYLTNTLEEVYLMEDLPPFASWLGEEAASAGKVKKDVPVMVVMGNPPYSGHSANKGEWIAKLLKGQDTQTGKVTDNYFEVDGEPLGERNPKWLNDDYVKFIRYSQRRINQTGYGILAFITNHGYLDNPTFRGMRQSLMNTFDDIYILDLHGNSKKQEKAPDGSKDKNVFDIQQGVAIGIFVKKHGDSKKPAKVHHADLWGEREVFKGKGEDAKLVGGKYAWLYENDVSSTKWKSFDPSGSFYLFAPQDESLVGEYEKHWKILDVMPVNVLGFQTHRDHFAVAFDKEILAKRIKEMSDENISDREYSEKYGIKSTSSWQLSEARKTITSDTGLENKFAKCLYRPFDFRSVYYSSVVIDRPRRELLDHVVGRENLCLGLGRQGIAVNDPMWSLITASTNPIDANIFRRGGVNVFPLFLYSSTEKQKSLLLDESTSTSDGRRVNFSKDFIEGFTGLLKMKFINDGKGDSKKSLGPEDIFNYMYAVFHSPAFRERYAQFLKIDFPRLPRTSDKKLFIKLCKLGDELKALHLMEKTGPEIATFPVSGTDIVDKIRYTEPGEGAEKGRVWINKDQYFDGVPPEIWEFHIGGYQVCEKWLKERKERKDRKGRKLEYEALENFTKMVSALSETIRLMGEIDKVIDKHGGFPEAFSSKTGSK